MSWREIGTHSTAEPLEDIASIRPVRFVVKDGRVYESAAVWKLVGVVLPSAAVSR